MVKFVGKYTVHGIENASILEAVEYCKELSLCGLDIETSKDHSLAHLETPIFRGGLDPFLSRVISIQIGDLTTQYFIDTRDFTKEELKPVIEFLHWNNTNTFVGHNLSFEGKHLRHKYGIRLRKVIDTMSSELALKNGLTTKLSLAHLASLYLGVNQASEGQISLWEDEEKITLDDRRLAEDEDEKLVTPFELANLDQINKSIRKGFVNMKDEPFIYEQVAYGADDIVYPLCIYNKQLQGITLYNGQWFCNPENMRFESVFTQVGADMALTGMPFDRDLWDEILEENKKEYKQRMQELNAYVTSTWPQFFQPSLFSETDGNCVVDWQSPKQVVNFFREIFYCPKEVSKQTGNLDFSVSAKAILPELSNEYKDNYNRNTWVKIDDFKSLMLGYILTRKSLKNITTYGKDFLKYVHPITKRIHPSYRLHLKSSRTAVTAPNLLAIPNGRHREAFSTRLEEDLEYIVNDYSSQESRVIAYVSKDEALLKFFNVGDEFYKSDFHSYTAGLVNKAKHPEFEGNYKPDKVERQNTKSINFGLAYGITAMSLSKQLGIPIEQAEELVEFYFKSLPKLEIFISSSKEEAIRNGFVIFEPRLNAIYIDDKFIEMRDKSEYCRGFFFCDEYKRLSKEDREVYKKDLYRENPKVKKWFSETGRHSSKLGNLGSNLKIQGTSAKMSKFSMIMMRKHSIENPHLNWEMALLLHDEVVSVGNKSTSKEIAELQDKYMIEAAAFFTPDVKFETGGAIGMQWNH